MPRTWEVYSKEVFGYIAPLTIENGYKVTFEKVSGWLADGYTEQQIFLIWNQGHAGECISGINSKGVFYDSCAYVENAMKTLVELRK